MQRAKAPTPRSLKMASSKKGKLLKARSRPTPPAATESTVLPRIDKRSDWHGSNNSSSSEIRSANTLYEPPRVSFELLPRRPSYRELQSSSETSPTSHSHDFDGPPAKAAWITPRSPLTEPRSLHLTSFFDTNTNHGDVPESPSPSFTSSRLKFVEENLLAADELYQVDFNKLCTDNDKFFEISAAATKHMDMLHEELPRLAATTQQASYVLHGCWLR